MTLSEARKNIVFAVSPKGFSAGMAELLAGKESAVIKEIYIDLQSRLICWTLEKAVKKEDIAKAVAACGAFLEENAPKSALKEAKAEVSSIAASSAAYLCRLHDEGRMGFIWGHDLCSGYWWSFRRGARFITSNPAKINVFRKDFPAEWAELVAAVRAENPGLTPEETVSRCWVKCVADIAKELRPIYDASFGKYGFVCIQPNPTKLDDTQAMVDEIRFFEKSFRRIFGTCDPNIVYKVPAVPAAREAVKILKKDGLRLCITLNFSVFQHDTFGDIIGYGERGDFLVLMGGIVDDFVKKELVSLGYPEAEAAEASHSAAAAILHRSYMNNLKKGIKPIIMAGSSRGAWSTAAMLCDDASNPVAITSMAKMIEIYDSEPRPNADVIHMPVDDRTMDILRKSAAFRAAYELSGLSDADVLDYGPLKFVSDSFISAYYETLESLK